MANYVLIDGYLESLRSSIRWRRDLDDVIAEMEDHLISAAERFEARGADRRAAQRRTLEQFGDPKVLAAAFASAPTGGIAVPTSFTKSAGSAAVSSASAWIVALVTIGISAGLPDATGVDPDQLVFNGQTVLWMIGTASLVGAGALMFVAMIGLYRRHGSLGVLGIGGLAVTGLGVATLLIAWAFGIWMTLIGLGVLLYAGAIGRRQVAPRVWTAVWGSGMAIGAGTWHALRWLQVGSPDQWGDYPVAVGVGLPVGVVIMAVGLAGIGRWLRNEEPVDLGPTEPIATA